MSNFYIQEPPSRGKILLKTSVGDIDIELWSKEAPKACRNFTQLCLEGYYDGTIFHRVVKGFVVQGGDPTGTGTGGESIYGEPFKDEIHSRLRFNRRGLVATANAYKDDNSSQFFFTLAPTPDLQNKHTIFGKVTGETIYNMIKLEDTMVDQDDRPLYPPKIIKTEVLSNPFPDIVPRVFRKKEREDKMEKKPKATGVNNTNLNTVALDTGAPLRKSWLPLNEWRQKVASSVEGCSTESGRSTGCVETSQELEGGVGIGGLRAQGAAAFQHSSLMQRSPPGLPREPTSIDLEELQAVANGEAGS